MILSDASEVNIWVETMCLKLMCLGQADMITAITSKHQVTLEYSQSPRQTDDVRYSADLGSTLVLHQDIIH